MPERAGGRRFRFRCLECWGRLFASLGMSLVMPSLLDRHEDHERAYRR